MHVVRLAVVTAIVCLAVPRLGPAQSPSVPAVIDVTPPAARRPAEVSVAINPTNPNHVIAVMMQSGAPGEARVTNWAYTSVDGGMTWKGAPAQNAEQRVQGDDAVLFGRDGVAYHSYISFDG